MMVGKEEVDHELLSLLCSTQVGSPSVSLWYVLWTALRSGHRPDKRRYISNHFTSLDATCWPPRFLDYCVICWSSFCYAFFFLLGAAILVLMSLMCVCVIYGKFPVAGSRTQIRKCPKVDHVINNTHKYLCSYAKPNFSVKSMQLIFTFSWSTKNSKNTVFWILKIGQIE